MKKRTKQQRLNAIIDLQEKARAVYGAIDELLAELRHQMKVGEILRVRRGRYQLVDNFKRANACYKPARICRFELNKLGRKAA